MVHIMAEYHQGIFKPKNKHKYAGNVDNIVYRSSWEKYVLKWCDSNPDIIQYSSEEIVIPYLYEVDNKYHRYFCDICIKWKDGSTTLVEIKPDSQTRPPKTPKRKTRGFINESLNYIKNVNKWDAAIKYCDERNWKFEIWTEHTLYNKGIMKKRKTSKLKTLKPMKPYRKKKKR